MANALRKYILCSSQRSGSSVFCRLLRMTGVLGAPAEYLVLGKLKDGNAEADPDRLARVAAERMRDHATPNGVTGVKLHFHQFEEFAGAVPLQAFGGFDLWVLVDRRDVIAQAVSLARAWQTRQYTSRQEVQGEASYSFDLIAGALRRLGRDKAGWSRYFAANSIRPMTVHYEDIVADPNSAVAVVLNGLGVSGARPVSLADVNLSVQRTEENLEWAERFQAEQRDRQSRAVRKPA